MATPPSSAAPSFDKLCNTITAKGKLGTNYGYNLRPSDNYTAGNYVLDFYTPYRLDCFKSPSQSMIVADADIVPGLTTGYDAYVYNNDVLVKQHTTRYTHRRRCNYLAVDWHTEDFDMARGKNLEYTLNTVESNLFWWGDAKGYQAHW